MSDVLGYLRGGIAKLDDAQLDQGALRVARHWVDIGIHAADIEIVSEYLARVAEQLELLPSSLPVTNVMHALNAWSVPAVLQDLLSQALTEPLSAEQCARAALHVLDIAERMGLRIYVAELPALLARADRSGDAARMVGVARHLKG